MPMIIDGKKIASDILERLAAWPKPDKFLAAVLVGDDSASISFLKQKEKTAQKLGVDFRLYQFPAAITKEVLCVEIMKIGDDVACGGIILQLPLPNRGGEQYVLNVIPQEKDVDVLSEKAFDAFRAGKSIVLPPAAGVVQEILSTFSAGGGSASGGNFQLSTSSVAVVGTGKLVGQPVAAWLTGKAKEVIILDKGDDLKQLKDADVVISGAGVPGLIMPDMLKENALVIDFGYGLLNGKPSGDLDSLEIAKLKIENFKYTPTPGGTGPILAAKLFENFYELNKK
jgi:methylenetetrahydrofolate dehydrogenase (NADP+)/methenyltetrahydrofolate cyclohydrolase